MDNDLDINQSSTNVKIDTKSVKKKKKKKRCFFKGCKVKLSFIDKQMTCKCKHNFCKIHRPLSSHKCSADHVAINKKYLTKNNPVVIPSKITAV